MENRMEFVKNNSQPTPPVIAICGVKNSGKTTFLEQILPLLKEKGVKVAVIKHDGHTFEPDVPGTDSRRMREAGATGTAVFSQGRWMVIREETKDLSFMVDCFRDFDLILVEGGKQSCYPKLELVRKAVSNKSVCKRDTLLALVTDLEQGIPGVEKIGLNSYRKAVEILIRHMEQSF